MRSLVFMGVLLLYGRARADEPIKPAMSDLAKSHLDAGLARYDARDYPAAIAEFRAGYTIDPQPDFLYNWAQAERLRGDCGRAAGLYRQFLATQPPPPQRDADLAHANLVRCEAALAMTGRPSPATGVTRPIEGTSTLPVALLPAASKRRGGRIAAILAGTGLASLAVGGAFSLSASAAEGSGRMAASYGAAESHFGRAETSRAIAVTGAAVGSLAVITGALWYLLN